MQYCLIKVLALVILSPKNCSAVHNHCWVYLKIAWFIAFCIIKVQKSVFWLAVWKSERVQPCCFLFLDLRKKSQWEFIWELTRENVLIRVVFAVNPSPKRGFWPLIFWFIQNLLKKKNAIYVENCSDKNFTWNYINRDMLESRISIAISVKIPF